MKFLYLAQCPLNRAFQDFKHFPWALVFKQCPQIPECTLVEAFP